MKSQSKISGILMAAALLVGVLALPAAGKAQATGSNASLADTITWLTGFVSTQTGAPDSNGTAWTSITRSTGGCNLTITQTYPSDSSPLTYTFSLSDIDPASISASGNRGVFNVMMATRSKALLIKETASGSDAFNYVLSVGNFADQSAAQRVANAFQHAAQLCANASPF